ncbi:hypothetical protein AB835_10860 [Candidatus Endobugula sertula]|uniref:Uncharacterized protein n=1 Tax=Candidatus Endobugula sertula TaxID=62101 RepID=A0A1D2QNB5_9GAMM|nr:hypothetical protein AB835_10860 [Candidatus Endobugula sertula]
MRLSRIASTSVLIPALSLATFPTAAKEFVIGLSPFYAAETRQQQVQQSLKFASALDRGDRVTFINAYHLETLGVFTVPQKATYASVKARLNFNKQAVGRLMRFAQDAPKIQQPPSIEGAVRLLQFLRHVAQNRQGNEAMDVMILGSPFYADAKDPEFLMVDGIIPSDGHLNVSREKSVYGIAGQEAALKNLRVHMAFGNAAMLSDRHSFRVERFWQLFVTEQGGEWVSFVQDMQSLFSRVKAQAPALPNPHQKQDGERLEMIRLQPVSVEAALHDRPLSIVQPSTAQISQAQNVEIAITWDQCHKTCDLDLHVRPKPNSKILSYRHTRSQDGIYYKDFRRSPQGTGGFETVELSTPVDLNHLVIAVNFFSGTAAAQGETRQGATGQIRLAIDGKTYGKAFTIPAKRGNGGKQVHRAFANGQSPSPHTILINPLSIIQP